MADTLKTLLRKRSSLKSKLTIYSNYLSLIKSSAQISGLQRLDLQERFNKFDSLHSQFDELQTEIELLADDAETAFVEREDFDRQFFNVVALTRSLLGSSVNGAANLKRPTQHWDDIIIFVMVKKLDLITSREWEEYRNNNIEALVNVTSATGKKYTARLLLDNGSTANFVTQSLAEKLGLSQRGMSTKVTGINNHVSTSTQSCHLSMESLCCAFSVDIDCHVLPEITKVLPSSFVNVKHLPLPSGLTLADPNFNVPSAVDILVGAEVFWNVIGSNTIDLGKNLPKLCETKFGWLVSGSPHHTHRTPWIIICLVFKLIQLRPLIRIVRTASSAMPTCDAY
ncbi:hypothetical protein SFRURICE_011618 [Spodoptera frugiperda]|nr:hypothetical protein SFRURICE_011618 [Spodoptera frugiperda]